MARGLEWNGDTLLTQLKSATAQGLMRAGQYYHTKCQLTVSKPNTGVSVKYKDQSKAGKEKRKSEGRNTSSRTVYPNPSRPGEPPRLRTSFGRRNIVVNHNPKGNTPWTRVGVSKNGLYMFYLEVGTRRIARRPWLLRTLQDNSEMIGKLAATGGRPHVQ